jgi:hypothetical protein
MIMRFALLAAALWLLWGCGPRSAPSTSTNSQAGKAAEPSPIRLRNVTEEAGIRFELGNGGKTPLTILETGGAGCAFLDFDADGKLDILLAGPFRVGLYRNVGGGKFEDVTGASGLHSNRHWQGCAVGDYDGDGLPDIFLSGYHCHALYRNVGGGKFRDVTAQAGIGGLTWSMSGAFADLTGDGRLDLYVAQYLRFDKTTRQLCKVGDVLSACGPEVYDPLSGRLFVNAGNGRFTAPPWKDTGKTWGALASDLANTGRPALYLANDMMPGDLWQWEGGKWHNVGPASGTAFDGQGHLQGGMGVDSGDYDNDGLLDLIVTTYFAQAVSLYHNDGDGLFTVTSSTTGIGPPTTPLVGFGVLFVDLDCDGWLDVVITNGHVRDNVHDFDTSQTYAQPIQVFRNQGGKRFTDVSAAAGVSGERLVGRGMAVGDYDGDGKPDLLIANLEGRSLLLRNESETGSWLAVTLKDRGPNRFGLGARLTLKAGDTKQIREIRTSGSVLSANEPAAYFGLGAYTGPATLEVRWPDGRKQTVAVPEVNRRITVSRPPP